MMPDPELLRLAAGSAMVASQHCDHAEAIVRWAARGVTPAEGGETLERLAMQLRAAAVLCRKTEKSLVALAGDEAKEAGDVMPNVNGTPFRCDCGCNVFRWVITEAGKRLRCNACSALFVADEKEAGHDARA